MTSQLPSSLLVFLFFSLSLSPSLSFSFSLSVPHQFRVNDSLLSAQMWQELIDHTFNFRKKNCWLLLFVFIVRYYSCQTVWLIQPVPPRRKTTIEKCINITSKRELDLNKRRKKEKIFSVVNRRAQGWIQSKNDLKRSFIRWKTSGSILPLFAMKHE